MYDNVSFYSFDMVMIIVRFTQLSFCTKYYKITVSLYEIGHILLTTF